MLNPRRRDIQGLRAVAVLVVVLFHAKMGMVGGFIGVDVFFVISGFVITGMLRREYAEHGRIRFGRFYLRRFKRLTPALAVMVAAVVVLSAFVLSPVGQQQTAGQTAIGAMLLSANFVIAQLTGGYFDAPADENPLLNTWSLSVEEQFYLVFPAILAVAWFIARRVRNRRLPLRVVWLVIITSFALAVWGSSRTLSGREDMLAGFYSPLTRAWEFGVGAALALSAARFDRLHRTRLAGAALLGSAMVLTGLYAISGATPFPGPWTLLPVVGTALLIIGCSRGTTNPTARLLNSGAMVKIGDWSYSIYLWHWPMIVLASHQWPLVDWAPAAAAAFSIVPAVLSYKFVEEPLRRRSWRSTRQRRRFIGTVFATPIGAAVLVWGLAAIHFAPKYASGQVASSMAGELGDQPFYEYLRDNFQQCENPTLSTTSPNYQGIVRCFQSRPGPVDTVILGDSHAEHLFPGFAELATTRNVAVYVVDGDPVASDAGFARVLHEVAGDATIRTFIVNAHWRGRGLHADELPATLAQLTTLGRQVFITDDNPSFKIPVFDCKYGGVADCRQSMDLYRQQNRNVFRTLRSVSAQVPGTMLLNSANYFCKATTCSMIDGTTLMFRNAGHLNVEGSRVHAARLVRDNPGLASALGVSST